MASNFLFSALEGNDKKIVIDAMQERRFEKGEAVIVQGEMGEDLFIVDQGHLECYKKFDNQPQEKLLRSYNAGDAFGELALLYNAPRFELVI